MSKELYGPPYGAADLESMIEELREELLNLKEKRKRSKKGGKGKKFQKLDKKVDKLKKKIKRFERLVLSAPKQPIRGWGEVLGPKIIETIPKLMEVFLLSQDNPRKRRD